LWEAALGHPALSGTTASLYNGCLVADIPSTSRKYGWLFQTAAREQSSSKRLKAIASLQNGKFLQIERLYLAESSPDFRIIELLLFDNCDS